MKLPPSHTLRFPGVVTSVLRSMTVQGRQTSRDAPVPLVWTEVVDHPPPLPVVDVEECPVCKAWTSGTCKTVQDMNACRNLDPAESAAVLLQPA
jgi:hypothetical protein